MRMRFLLLAMAVIACVMAFPPAAAAPEAAESNESLVKANNMFALDLYGKLVELETHKIRNIFFSPYSISSALAMTWAGA